MDIDQDTRFNRNDAELQAFLLLSICVAGKTAFVQERKLRDFLKPAIDIGREPFNWVRILDAADLLEKELRAIKMGQYRRILPAFRGVAQCDPRTVTLDELEAVKGIGPKTSRFFLIHSRQGLNLAVLDTHILAWLREQGVEAPLATPSGRAYKDLEQTFLDFAAQRGQTPADLDKEIWEARRRQEPSLPRS